MQRLQPFDLLVNGEDDDAIKAKIRPEDQGMIADAFRGWREEMLVVADLPTPDLEALIEGDIGGFLRLVMARYEREARNEFSRQLLVELAEVPVSLIRPALAEARRKISYPERLVPFIFDYIEADWMKLRTEGERLKRLAELAG